MGWLICFGSQFEGTVHSGGGRHVRGTWRSIQEVEVGHGAMMVLSWLSPFLCHSELQAMGWGHPYPR